MTMITPSYLGETIEYSSLHACRSTLEDPTVLGHWIVKKNYKFGPRDRPVFPLPCDSKALTPINFWARLLLWLTWNWVYGRL